MAQDIKLRKKDLKEPDKFVLAGGDFLAFLSHNKNLLIGLAVAVVLAVGGYLFIANQKKAENHRMESLYFQMTTKVEDRKGEVDSQLISELNSLLDQFKPGDQKTRAQLLLADIQHQSRDYDKAIALFKEVAGHSSPGSLNFNMAHSGIAYSYEGKKDYKSALTHYKKVMEHPGEFPLFHIHMSLSRCYELTNDSKNAILILREMETKFPKHADLEKVKLALKRLEGSA